MSNQIKNNPPYHKRDKFVLVKISVDFSLSLTYNHNFPLKFKKPFQETTTTKYLYLYKNAGLKIVIGLRPWKTNIMCAWH